MVTSSPVPIVPDTLVPVITVPKPFIVNTRSIGSLKRCPMSRSGISSTSLSRISIKPSSPSPVTEETSTTGAPSRKPSERYSDTSSLTRSSQSSSTISILVSTTIPCLIFKSSHISRCSLVCGITPSSAAITNATRSIPVAPATMFFTNFS